MNDVLTHYLWEIMCAVVFAAAVAFLYQLYSGAYMENEAVFRSIRAGQNVREAADLITDEREPEEMTMSGSTVFYEILEVCDSDFTGEIVMAKVDGTETVVREAVIRDAQSGSSGDLFSMISPASYYDRDVERWEDGSISRIVYTERVDLNE